MTTEREAELLHAALLDSFTEFTPPIILETAMTEREAERAAIVKWLRDKHAFNLVYALRYDDDCGAGDIGEILARAISRGDHLQEQSNDK